MRSTNNETPVERKLWELFSTLWFYRRRILKRYRRLREESIFLCVFFINFTKKVIYAIANATEGLVQHRFGNSGAKLQNSTAVLRLNFCAKLNICTSISATSQSGKTLAVMVGRPNRQQ